MSELIKNARIGWQDYTDAGKYAALLLISFMLLGLLKDREKWDGMGRRKNFALYTGLMTVGCIFPFTAALLMAYQTRFYDYQWVWTLVPITGFVAMTGTIFLAGQWKHFSKEDNGKWKMAGVAGLTVLMILFSGRFGEQLWDAKKASQDLAHTKRILQIIRQERPEDRILLVAPQEIMENVRAVDGNVILPYGRNMWDKALDAYSYDTYDTSRQRLYEWMQNVAATGQTTRVSEEGDVTTLSDCLHIAAELGVECLILPGTLSEEGVSEVDADLGEARVVEEGYLIFWL